MKKTFTTLYIVLIVLLYLLAAVFGFSIGVNATTPYLDIFVNIFMGLAIGVGIYMVLLIILVLCLMKKIDLKPSIVLGFKISLIPFYLFFFIIGILMIIGFISPYLWLILILTYVFSIGFGYILVLTTSLPNIISISKSLLRQEKEYRSLKILCLVFQFFFVLDVVGAIILYIFIPNKSDKRIEESK